MLATLLNLQMKLQVKNKMGNRFKEIKNEKKHE